MNTIIDSGNVMEAEGIDLDNEAPDFADMTATEEADATTMDFHVQMRGYTMSDFETMVVHAAATQLFGGGVRSRVKSRTRRQRSQATRCHSNLPTRSRT